MDRPRSALPRGDSNQNPWGVTLPQLLREDFRTHGSHLASPGFWALAVHRFGNWRMSVRPRMLRGPLSLVYRFGHATVINAWAIDLPYNARIGRRVRFDHHGGIFIGSRAIGDDVIVRHAVTIGLIRRGAVESPIIGNRVEIGPGACIVGGIYVGDDAYIGANTVVATDVAPHGTMLGNPARTVSRESLTATEQPSVHVVSLGSPSAKPGPLQASGGASVEGGLREPGSSLTAGLSA